MSVEPEHVSGDVYEALPVKSATAIESMARGELEMMIEQAKKHPRSIKKFMNEATTLATLNESVASMCFYVLPGRKDKRTGKKGAPIEGPSARFAEIIASSWGNCQAGARVLGEDDSFVTSQGVFRDLEKNLTIVFEAKRRITTKEGGRFGDDMIMTTTNAASSIALRNAVFKGIPKAFWQPIYEAARKAAIGDTKTIAKKRADMIGYFGKMGVDAAKILYAVGKAAIEEIGEEELIQLKGMATAIKDGELKVDDAFPDPKKADDNERVEKLKERIKEPPLDPPHWDGPTEEPASREADV